MYNKIFEETGQAKRLEHPIFVVLITIIIFFLSMIGSALFFTPHKLFTFLHYMGISGFTIYGLAVIRTVSLILFFLPTIFLVWLWVHFFQKRSFRSMGFFKEVLKRGYTIGMVLAFVAFSLVILGSITFGGGHFTFSEHGLSQRIILILIGLPFWIIQTASEETLSRGYILSTVGAKNRPVLGIFLSAILFSFAHLLNPGVSLIAVVNIFLVGLTFASMVLYYENIWITCGFHFIWNAAQANFYGATVSGAFTHGDTILRFHGNPSANPMVNGGAFGVEASLLTTVLFLFMAIYFGVKLYRKGGLYNKA